MGMLYFDSMDIIGLFPTSTIGIGSGNVVAVQRIASDPIYWRDLVLQNVQDGSQYWIAESANLSNVIASGTKAGSGDLVIPRVPATSENMLVTIRVRKGTSGTKYLPFETQTPIQRVGGLAYILQTIDPIA